MSENGKQKFIHGLCDLMEELKKETGLTITEISITIYKRRDVGALTSDFVLTGVEIKAE